MATENSILRLSFEAAEDLSDYQYHFVCLHSTEGKVRLPDSASERPIGILQNAPASGEEASVMVLGVSKLVANALLAVDTLVRHEYVGATDAGKGQDAGTGNNTQYTMAHDLDASAAEDDLCTVELIGPFAAYPDRVGLLGGTATVTTDSTAGANTWTAAEILGGILLRDPAGADRSDVTPTAALIVAGITNAAVGMWFEFVIRNTADANETITLTAGTNVTLSGNMTIPRDTDKRFIAVLTNVTASSEAVSIYSLGPQTGSVPILGKVTVTTDTTAGANTWTAAELLGGLCLRDPAGADRSDVTPTGTLIGAALTDAGVTTLTGTAFEFTIRNTADANETITLTAGEDVILSGNMTIPWNCSKRFICVMTADATCTIYALSDAVEFAGGPILGRITATTDATAGANTWSAAEMLGGLLLRDPAGADRSDVTDTATNITTALVDAGISSGNIAGTSFEFTIRNTADANETITLTAGEGITLSGNMTIPWNCSKRFACIMATATTCTIYAVADAVEIGGAPRIFNTELTTDTTAGAVTYTAAQLLGGLILRDPNGGARSDVTPTGTQIQTALVDAGVSAGNIVGKTFTFTILNTANAAETITLTNGAGVTMSGNCTIAQLYGNTFLCRMTAANTATIYDLGTVLYSA